MGDLRVVIRPGAIDEYARSPAMRDGLLEAADPLVHGIAAAAPKRTGRGAADIRAEPVLDGPTWTARVGWGREVFYMYFHERGTRSLPARPFAVPTLEGMAQ